jgi:ribonuclease Z
MGSSFLPRLVNGPFDDPALYVRLRHQQRALLFDLGDITPLTSRDILKLSHIFVSHTHMDHFCGFDHVLRLMLGRDKTLHLYGPQGFLDNLEGKLGGYLWNLVEGYTNRFVLTATELHEDHAIRRSYPCRNGFRPVGRTQEFSFNGVVIEDPAFSVRAVHLDHGTPVLAFSLTEPFHINIKRTQLERLGLKPGPWLGEFKRLIYANADSESPIDASMADDGIPAHTRRFMLGTLKTAIVHITPGQHLAYITDASGTPENFIRITQLAAGADHLFVEATFSDRHRDVAFRKHHLTARQAGQLARLCRVKQYHLFHHSPRYTDAPHLLASEAAMAFYGNSAAEGDTCLTDRCVERGIMDDR